MLAKLPESTNCPSSEFQSCPSLPRMLASMLELETVMKMILHKHLETIGKITNHARRTKNGKNFVNSSYRLPSVTK